jgi:hypothetical protein
VASRSHQSEANSVRKIALDAVLHGRALQAILRTLRSVIKGTAL